MACRCKEKAKRIAKGAVGLTKAALGIDPASPDRVVQRLNICRRCRHFIQGKGYRGKERCKLCGCLLRAKVRINSEKCPEEKW